jgi:hypothetical protein
MSFLKTVTHQKRDIEVQRMNNQLKWKKIVYQKGTSIPPTINTHIFRVNILHIKFQASTDDDSQEDDDSDIESNTPTPPTSNTLNNIIIHKKYITCNSKF